MILHFNEKLISWIIQQRNAMKLSIDWILRTPQHTVITSPFFLTSSSSLENTALMGEGCVAILISSCRMVLAGEDSLSGSSSLTSSTPASTSDNPWSTGEIPLRIWRRCGWQDRRTREARSSPSFSCCFRSSRTSTPLAAISTNKNQILFYSPLH